MTVNQRRVLLAVVFIALLLLMSGWLNGLRIGRELKAYERQAADAKTDAKAALDKATQIAREKLAAERQLAELEAERDGKQTEEETARIAALDARADYDRAVREQRTDDPSAEQLCAELAALGYACR